MNQSISHDHGYFGKRCSKPFGDQQSPKAEQEVLYW